MTQELCIQDSYLKQCNADVLDEIFNAVILSQTVFYPPGEGQPGDDNNMLLTNASIIEIRDTQKA